jgi:hypothetical protein
MHVVLPILYAIDTKVARNALQQVLLPAEEVEVTVKSNETNRLLLKDSDGREILLVGKGATAPKRQELVDEQLTLLAVSENYLWQTYQIPLDVIVSA